MRRVISDSNINKQSKTNKTLKNNIVRRTKSESFLNEKQKLYFIPKLRYKQKKQIVKLKTTHNATKELFKICQDLTYAYELSKKQTHVEFYFSVLFFLYMLETKEFKNQQLRLGLIAITYVFSINFL